MVIFINDVPVRICRADEVSSNEHFNYIIDASKEKITKSKLVHHVWIKNVSEAGIDILLDFLNTLVPTALLSVYVTGIDYDELKAYLKSKFKLVKAAGGLIRKKGKFLLIYRLKKWDLPKGKKERKEGYKETAIREVEEECNVAVRIGPKICTTWHTYTMNRRSMLKKTKWYFMDLIDDAKMKPNTEEDIEDVRWMNPKEVYHALEHSYKSIHYVFEQYHLLTSVKS